MPLTQVKFVAGSFAPIQKKEIVRKLANVIRARKRPCAAIRAAIENAVRRESGTRGKASTPAGNKTHRFQEET